MAPLQPTALKCIPLETGICNSPTGIQYYDNDGKFNDQCGRPEERLGFQGSFTHGVTIFRGGIPRESEPKPEVSNRGTILYISPILKHDSSVLPTCKPGSSVPFAASATFPVLNNRRVIGEVNWQCSDSGKILETFPDLLADTSYLGMTNTVGGRPTERRGLKGGFTRGVRRWRGGEPQDAPVIQTIDPGTILLISQILKPNLASLPQVKPGTCNERLGKVGSFEYGESRLHMPTKLDAELWIEDGQQGGRRYSCGHFLAGASTLLGGMPVY